MQIVRKKFIEWDESTKRKLRRATVNGGYLRRYARAFPGSSTIVAVGTKGEIMGWAFALEHDGLVSLSLFVHKRYRKHGLATRLIEEALKDFPRIALARWDEKTRRLFSKLRAQFPNRIMVYDWWKNQHRYDALTKAALSRQ